MDNNRSIRDSFLKSLMAAGFEGEQLQTLDKMLVKCLAGYNIMPAETHLSTIDSCIPEIMQYLVRKKAKGLAESTLEQYALVLKAFSIYVPKKITDITEWDILLFLDNYEKDRGISKCRKETMRVILNGFLDIKQIVVILRLIQWPQ